MRKELQKKVDFAIKEEENTRVYGKSQIAEGLDKGRTEEIYIGSIPKRKGKI